MYDSLFNFLYSFDVNLIMVQYSFIENTCQSVFYQVVKFSFEWINFLIINCLNWLFSPSYYTQMQFMHRRIITNIHHAAVWHYCRQGQSEVSWGYCGQLGKTEDWRGSNGFYKQWTKPQQSVLCVIMCFTNRLKMLSLVCFINEWCEIYLDWKLHSSSPAKGWVLLWTSCWCW